MSVARLGPTAATMTPNTAPRAQALPNNFTRGAGSTSFLENYRILENGEGRLLEDEEVLELES